MRIQNVFGILMGVCLWFTASAQNSLNTFNINSVADLKEFFRYTPDRIPLICAHRGGASVAYPENHTVTFEHALSRIHTFFELDPRLTKDGEVIVMHDATLNRTTNGTGNIIDHTLDEIKQLKLKDTDGNLTQYSPQTLDEIVKWAKGKTVLMLDKKDVPFEKILQIIEDNNAESYVLISSYTPEEAKWYYDRNPNIMFEAFILNNSDYLAYQASGVPWENIVAYLSQSTSTTLYNNLHAQGVMCIFYTAKELEEEPDAAIRIASYRAVANGGADILLSERLTESYQAIKDLWPSPSSKNIFFNDADDEPNTETVTDIDGNVYHTVKIGDQIWTTTNLKVTKYNDGTPIPTGLSNTNWQNATAGAYTVYPFADVGEANEAAVIAKYGLLYNGHAAKNAKLVPVGWRVPTDEDWLALEIYSGIVEEDARSVDNGYRGLISPRLKSVDIWQNHPTKSGWDDFGFAALPGGNRLANGTYQQVNQRGYFWTSTAASAANTYRRVLVYDIAGIHRSSISSSSGYSIRLIKDNSVNPVRLSALSAKLKNNVVSIEWTTASELNNACFEIEYSADGQHFYTLVRIGGAGTSNIPRDYSYVHLTPTNGANYYRLKQVDYDGHSIYCGVRTVNFGVGTATTVVYPNPSQGEIFVKSSKYNRGQVKIKLVSMNGDLIHQELQNADILQQGYQLQLPQKPSAGQYILLLENKDNSEKIKITIQ